MLLCALGLKYNSVLKLATLLNGECGHNLLFSMRDAENALRSSLTYFFFIVEEKDLKYNSMSISRKNKHCILNI